jgi:NitT/TauT family transport system substrate-binding protein
MKRTNRVSMVATAAMNLKAVMWAVAFVVGGALLTGCGSKDKTAEQVTIRFGVLPVLQALELFVAEERGYFTEAGVKVELINFNTAAEKDIALTSNQLDGYFGDLFTPIVIEGNGMDIAIVATNYNTQADRHMFGLLASQKSGIRSLAELDGVPIAISSNSVIHYVSETLALGGGIEAGGFATMESKNIGLRMQMLMSGQVKAATLPEPLVTAAVAGGAVLLADDQGVTASQTVLVFTQKFIDEHPATARGFLAAVARAGEYCNISPDSVRSVMTSKVRLPEPLKAVYPVPEFPELTVPGSELVEAVTSWLHGKGVVRREIAYGDLVNGDFLE